MRPGSPARRPARKGRRFHVTRLQGQRPPTMCHPTPTAGVATTPFYSPPSLCARVARSDWRSFAIKIHRVDTARKEDA
ncbi:hypothetical protein B296_00043361 [Ensete ventricosum]|uniref:Uncharacterized protein n=1 Tax=Ensete ventricosum TaxID=4639 RepID=A0A426YM06_ENSVE|nr:hypothetical protein B296_00043361 [Ensete ventricosum]